MEPSFSCWPAMMLLCNSVRIFPVHIALKLICSAYLNFIANFLNSYHVFQLPVCPANFPATFQHVLRLLQLPLRPPTLISRKLLPNVGSMQLSPHNNLPSPEYSYAFSNCSATYSYILLQFIFLPATSHPPNAEFLLPFAPKTSLLHEILSTANSYLLTPATFIPPSRYLPTFYCNYSPL